MGARTYYQNLSREVKFSYLQTLQIQEDTSALPELAGTSEGISFAATRTYGGRSGFLGIGAKGASSASTSVDDSGWSISRQWQETYYDKIRYAIGIRDVGAFSYRYAPASEIVSLPFRSPKEVLKIELRVDEFIPSVLSSTRRWIEYYVSITNGKTWLRINPLDQPTLFETDGSIVPRTITLNLDDGGPQGDDVQTIRTEAPVFGVRFRAVMYTDSTVADGDRFSPVLKGYRLLMLPRGGLKDSGI
jgi:hypothetical protein